MTTGYYPPMPRSPVTELSAGIDGIVTDVPVVNAALLPAGPNTATIGGGADSETIKYTGKTGNTLTGCTRGFDPAGSAKAWDSGTPVARVITSQDIKALQDGVTAKPDLGETATDAYRGDRGKTAYDHSQAVTGAEHGAVSAATANMLVRRDASGRAKVAAPSAVDDIARKQEVDAHANAVTGAEHGAVSAATVNMIVRRDSAGRAKVVAPAAADDIARKDTVDAGGTALTNHLASNQPHREGASLYLTVKEGSIFKTLEFKRSDGTLFKKSVLSGGTAPKYTTRTVTFYAANGTTVDQTITYTLSYDVDDDLISEVIT